MSTIRNKLIAVGFSAWALWVRIKRRFHALFRPRLGVVDHVTIPVRDLDVARRFYCDVLGAAHLMTIDAAALERFKRPPAEKEGDGVYHVSLLFGCETRLDLFLQNAGQPPLTQGHPHYAFRVPPRQIKKWKRRLEACGVPSEGPLQLGFPGQASLYFNDPFGNHLEIVCTGFGEPVPIRPPTMTGLAWRSPHFDGRSP